jgi:hypothetical protein
MKRMRLAALSLFAVSLMGAALASSSSAYLPVNFRTGIGKLPVPYGLTEVIEIWIFGIATKSGTTGEVNCSNGSMAGTLESNGAAKDKAVFDEVAFTGTGIGGACESSLGPATITTSDLPWPNEFTNKKTLTIKGTKKVAFSVTYIGAAGEPKCTYEAGKVSSTFTAGAAGHPEPVTITTSDQKFKLNKKASAKTCATEGQLSASTKATAGGETVEAEL